MKEGDRCVLNAATRDGTNPPCFLDMPSIHIAWHVRMGAAASKMQQLPDWPIEMRPMELSLNRLRDRPTKSSLVWDDSMPNRFGLYADAAVAVGQLVAGVGVQIVWSAAIELV